MTAAAPEPEAAADVPAAPVPPPAVVEVGWLLVGPFDKALDQAARRARGLFVRQMRDSFPEFDWRVPLVTLSGVRGEGVNAAVEPVMLLDAALQEREAHRWDFAIALWPGELVGYERNAPLGAPSSAVGCAVMSAGRLWEACEDPNDKACRRQSIETTSRRIAHLAAHLQGHLVGIGHVGDPVGFMHPPHTVHDLDRMQGYTAETIADLREELADVADPRLEEEGGSDAPIPPTTFARFAGRAGRLKFALLAAWQNLDDVARIVARIKPWQIPRRLGRLTAAAASSLVILLMTAETWEAGMSQPAWRAAVLSLIALVVASGYVIHRQRLLIHEPRGGPLVTASRHDRPARLSEQRSVGNVAVSLAVVAGMITTYAALFVASMVIAWSLYPPSVVNNWAASVPQPVSAGRYAILSAFVAALCLMIGALGAGFEPRGYVRHVAYVDEEV